MLDKVKECSLRREKQYWKYFRMTHYICCDNNKMCNDNLTLFSLPFSCYVFTNIQTDHPSKIKVMIYIKTVHDLDMF